MFRTPTDTKLLNRWNEVIPRKGTKLQPSSKVCTHRFETDDLVKGRWIEDGQRIFYPWNNWVLKKGAIPSIFPSKYFPG